MAITKEVYDLFVKKDGNKIAKPVKVFAYKKRTTPGTAASIAGWERVSLIDPLYDNPNGGVVHIIGSKGETEAEGYATATEANHALISHFKQYVYFLNSQFVKGDTNYQSFWPVNITTLANVQIWKDGIDPFA